MVIGTGIDVMALNDMERELARGPWTAADGIFRESELRQCRHGGSRARSLSACYVAKEAAAKALNLHVSDLGVFREIEVINVTHDHIKLSFHGRAQEQFERLGATRVLTSVHADRHLAAAMVILEK